MSANPMVNDQRDAYARNSAMAMQKWGGLASFLLVVAFIVAPPIYLFGSLRDSFGRTAYDLADLLYGPVWAASLVTAVFALRERIGARAPRRMTLALLAATLSAGMMAAAFFRSTNRHYHLMHPNLNLELNSDVLVMWGTLVAGVIATALHFLGWSLALLGWAGWTTRCFPHVLCMFYLVGGVAALFGYLFPVLEEITVMLGVVWAFWRGILLWKAEPR